MKAYIINLKFCAFTVEIKNTILNISTYIRGDWRYWFYIILSAVLLLIYWSLWVPRTRHRGGKHVIFMNNSCFIFLRLSRFGMILQWWSLEFSRYNRRGKRLFRFKVCAGCQGPSLVTRAFITAGVCQLKYT